MGRTYLILIVMLGLLGSALNNCSMRSSSRFDGLADRSDAHLNRSSSTDEAGDGSSVPDGTVELERSSDGHFYADVELNGSPVRMLVDTGATGIALSREDARSAGIATSIGMNEVVGEGADGDVRGEFVTLDRVRLGHKSGEGMRAVVLNGGEQSLLGQSFLSKFESVEIQGDRMRMR